MKSNMNKFPEPRMPANDNVAPKPPENRPFLTERPSGAIHIDKEQGIRRMAEELVASGELSAFSEEAVRGAEHIASELSLEHVISAINNSEESDWRKYPALYVAYANLIAEFRRQQETEG